MVQPVVLTECQVRETEVPAGTPRSLSCPFREKSLIAGAVGVVAVVASVLEALVVPPFMPVQVMI